MTGIDAPSPSLIADRSSTFFSYSREDQGRAMPIIRVIEQAGFPVWWDGLLGGGDRFSQTTEDALNNARAVVVLWSKTSIQSHWVHDEATRGRDRQILVPLSLDGSAPPLGFGQFQAINLSRSKISTKDPAIQQLLRALELLHGTERQPDDGRVFKNPSHINRRVLIGTGAAIAVAAGGAAAWTAGLFGEREATRNRIAVLPFANIGGDPERAYLADGLCAEIRSMLAQNGALQVVGQASSEAFTDSKLDSVAIAKNLRADFLVDGAVQIAGGLIRITAELIEGKSGINRLPQKFEQPMDDILAVQREIAAAISAKLTSKIATSDSGTVAIGGTANVIAFDHYLRGKDLYAHAKDEAEEREAVSQFESAISADPKFAAAHAGLARSLAAISGSYGSVSEIRYNNSLAVNSARRAIKLAPKFADAHSALALMLFQGNLDIRSAKEPFDLSRSLGEGEAPVQARFASYCASTGRDGEALTAIERALLLDPLNALIHRIGGTVHFAARRYPQAIKALRGALKINPDLNDAHSRIGMVLLAQNEAQEALAEFGAETHKWSKLAGLGIAEYRLGNQGAATLAMEALAGDTETVSLYQQGQILAQWEKPVDAVAILQRAYEQRDAGLIAANYDPMLDPLRQQPGFIRLLKLMGFD